jgi:hypothetical protein
MNTYYTRDSAYITNWVEVVVYGRERVIAICPTLNAAQNIISGLMWAESETSDYNWEIES